MSFIAVLGLRFALLASLGREHSEWDHICIDILLFYF